VAPGVPEVFLASESAGRREHKVRSYLRSEPGISLLLAAVNFEWTVSRAVLCLSRTPNAELRRKMAKYYSLDGCKDLWRAEVMPRGDQRPLPEIVQNWHDARKAFEARNVLVHGKGRYTRNMATPHVEALLKAVGYVDAYCTALGVDLGHRMPVRRKLSVVGQQGAPAVPTLPCR